MMGRAIGRWYRPYLRIDSVSASALSEHQYKGIADTIVQLLLQFPSALMIVNGAYPVAI
jgi:hypothetical protein